MKFDLPILVVDDEPQVRTLIRRILAQKGLLVVEAADGPSGYSALVQLRGKVHLVISDISMPGYGGDVLSRKIKSAYPQLPVLLTSGNPGVEDTMSCDRFVNKPFYPSILAQAVDDLLEGRQCA